MRPPDVLELPVDEDDFLTHAIIKRGKHGSTNIGSS